MEGVYIDFKVRNCKVLNWIVGVYRNYCVGNGEGKGMEYRVKLFDDVGRYDWCF